MTPIRNKACGGVTSEELQRESNHTSLLLPFAYRTRNERKVSHQKKKKASGVNASIPKSRPKNGAVSNILTND